jgi:hypothetical protein
MVFTTDGSTHRTGIQNEHEIVDFLNAFPENEITCRVQTEHGETVDKWEHRGGTQQKEDCIAKTVSGNEIGVSIKHRKDKGTYDLINTTKMPTIIRDVVYAGIDEFKKKHLGVTAITTEIRNECASILNASLNSIEPHIAPFLDDLYQKYPPWLLVHHAIHRKCAFFAKTNLRRFMRGDARYRFKPSTRAQTSRQLFIENGNDWIDTGFRVRLVLNNGVNALLGLSTSNKTSVPTIKIQQDHVSRFLDTCENVTVIDYSPLVKDDMSGINMLLAAAETLDATQPLPL